MLVVLPSYGLGLEDNPSCGQYYGLRNCTGLPPGPGSHVSLPKSMKIYFPCMHVDAEEDISRMV